MTKIPKHVAIVMDGNGRWAKQRHLPRAAGHRAGAKAVRRVVGFCIESGVEVLTLFALSVENRNCRPLSEISLLMGLFLESLQRNTEELHQNNVRIRVIGERNHFDPKLIEQIQNSEQLTAQNTGLTLVIAIHYSGRWDMVQATQRLATRVQNGELNPADITAHTIQGQLCLSDLSEPDLLIRTSGEQRISNFMLWQLAYTELFFTEVFWPDFDIAVFNQALYSFQIRERRFGGVSEQVELSHA